MAIKDKEGFHELLWSNEVESGNPSARLYFSKEIFDNTYNFKFTKNSKKWWENQIYIRAENLPLLIKIIKDLLDITTVKHGVPAYNLVYENYIKCQCAGLCQILMFRRYKDGRIYADRYVTHNDKDPHEVSIQVLKLKDLLYVLEREVQLLQDN